MKHFIWNIIRSYSQEQWSIPFIGYETTSKLEVLQVHNSTAWGMRPMMNLVVSCFVWLVTSFNARVLTRDLTLTSGDLARETESIREITIYCRGHLFRGCDHNLGTWPNECSQTTNEKRKKFKNKSNQPSLSPRLLLLHTHTHTHTHTPRLAQWYVYWS